MAKVTKTMGSAEATETAKTPKSAGSPKAKGATKARGSHAAKSPKSHKAHKADKPAKSPKGETAASSGAREHRGGVGAGPGELQAAAFFDLDRTLLSGASGPAITAALRAVGLVSDRSVPGQDLIFRVFNIFGENLPSMMLTRQAASLAANWSRASAQEAGQLAADVLVTLVQPYAEGLMSEHRQAGRLLVLATTTPYDLVKPLADRLGFDALVATRYGERDGVYDGSIDGEFVWGHGKYRAVVEWAHQHGVDLATSFAYSDSYYDVPLLNAVGHPEVVNPDPRMRLQALARRWPTRYLDAPPGVPKLAGIEPQKLLMPLVRPELTPFAKVKIEGVDHIPAEGPAILCANHRSYFDVSAVAYAVAKRGRPVRFLGKKEVFDAPIVGDLARAMGGIRVERGSGRDDPLQEALTALQAGEMVVIMPQGTIPRGRAFFDPLLKGRWGAARLAALSGAPVIPMGLWGTERVWPRRAKVPSVWNITDPPAVSVRVGPPVPLDLVDADEDTEAIMAAIVDLLPPEARLAHEPTADELAAATPSGSRGEAGRAEHEDARRPGTD
jgi:putative phosphoserine phosphatase / 1-acylglycerol-3-phosphate O-acyltransferase